MIFLKRDYLWMLTAITFFMAIVSCPIAGVAQKPCAVSPSVGGTPVLPNALVIFDNSGSMTEYAHDHAIAYNSATTYAGIFDSGKRYSYNTTSNYFYENDPGGAWSGNFLNWACMLRIDVARKVMTGGKVITDGGNKYITDNNYSMDAPEYTYDDTSGQTPWSGSYKYRFLSNTSAEWGQLRVRNMSNVTQATYNIRILVSADYAATGILHTLQDKVRLGLMHFNSDREGGYIRRYVQQLDSAHLANIVSDLNRDLGDDYDWSYTPLAETLYSATRYFSQVAPGSYYHATDYLLPTKNVAGEVTANPEYDPLYNEDYTKIVWCAKNYVILLTDGESTQDLNIPAALQDYDGDGCDPCPCGCDGYTCSSCPLDINGSAYLDDIAYYAYTTDLRGAAQDNLPGTQNLTLYAVYMFGQTGWADVLLKKAAEDQGGGRYFLASDADVMTTALQSIFQLITQQAAAAASTAITSEPVSGTDLIYIPYYKHPQEDQWWGNIRAFTLDNNGNLINQSGGVAADTDGDYVLDNPIWDASLKLQTMDKNNREIFTYISGSMESFVTGNNSLDKYFDVNLDGDSYEDESAEADALISYIRGTDNAGGFDLRDRNNFYLGDIMHASPYFVGKPSARFDLIYGDTSYWDYYWDDDQQNRRAVLYAGANDGMLHCFDATNDATRGEEVWAYIPYNLLPHLKWLADPTYCHCYYVDLSAKVWDIKWSGSWKSVLLGAMRLGGTPEGVDTTEPSDGSADETLRSALFALNVTDPNNPQVLWEISEGTTGDKFGYTISKPIPIKVRDKWYLVFGSGPKSRDGEGAPSPGDGYSENTGYIFIVDPADGAIVRRFELGTLGAGNFFGSPVAVDYDLDYSVDMIYIGDALGNLWRIKTFTGSETDGSKVYADDQDGWILDVATDNAAATNPQPLLSLGADQPILMKPEISVDRKGRVWIYVGTGRYFCSNDNLCCGAGSECPPGLVSGSCPSGECSTTETINGAPETRSRFMAVGVYDRHWYTDSDPTKSKFVLQSSTIDFVADPTILDHRVIVTGDVAGSPGSTGYAIVDANYPSMDISEDVCTTCQGWYFRLFEERERCLGDFLVYGGAVFFISYKPANDPSDPCTTGGTSYLYGVYYTSGTSTEEPLFDLTGEGIIDSGDLVKKDGKTFGPAMKRLDRAFAGGSPKAKEGSLYTPLPIKPEPIEPPETTPSTGVTSWKEVLQ